MNRRSLLKTLILAPLIKLLPKTKPDKDILEIPDSAFSDWTFTCNGSSATSNTILYILDSEEKYRLTDQTYRPRVWLTNLNNSVE